MNQNWIEINMYCGFAMNGQQSKLKAFISVVWSNCVCKWIHNDFYLNNFSFDRLSVNFFITDRYVIADTFDIQGPSFTIEPPHHLEFTNIVDNHVDCVAKGSPRPKIEWLHLDNTLVTTIPRVSILFFFLSFKCIL